MYSRPILKAGWSYLLYLAICAGAVAEERPNILFLSVDDMSCDSIGAFGCRLEGTTPHIDKLAAEGLRFMHAHVQVGNCMPSRNVMFSGRYPHNNRVEGFYQVRDIEYPVLTDLMTSGGYFTAIRGKVAHSTPYHPYSWDIVLDTVDGRREHPKDVGSYYRSTRKGIDASQEAGKPFCLLVNVSDPHKPFYGIGKQNRRVNDPHVPSRIFTADEVPVPGFLFDHPGVREELALYYTTVRRADDCVGEVLRALDESGQAENTVVVFLSDHGMPLPFAKTQIYHHSTHTPWIVRWPGVTAENAIDDRHMISAVDLLPTLLDVAGIEHPSGLDGRSFLSLLRGGTQPDRDVIFKVYNENSGGNRHPMRGVQSKRYGYIFNPWSDGDRVFKTATTGTETYRTMRKVAATNPEIAGRLDLFDHRVLEEFYDYEKDPDALNNLIDDPELQPKIDEFRRILEQWMAETGDHALDAFRERQNPERLAAYMDRVNNESALRRGRKNAKSNSAVPQRRNDLIAVRVPTKVETLSPITVEVRHSLPSELKSQMLHVTLKDQVDKQRIERQVVSISGSGTTRVVFQMDAKPKHGKLEVAAFVGVDYDRHLQHVVSRTIVVQSQN